MRDQQIESRTRESLRGNPRPWSENAMVDAARKALDAAVAMARSGDRQGARELCAAIVFDGQPIIAARAELLRRTVYALLVAHGFRLLSRVVLTMSGRSVQVTLLPYVAGPVVPPRMREEQWRTICMLDPRWIERLSPDDMLLQHWWDALVAHRNSRAAQPQAMPAARHLETV
jgi:hypothetical protein